jgi:hypothetical protein
MGTPLGPGWGPPRSLQWVSSRDGTDTGPILTLKPLSTILPGNCRHLRHLQALDRPTLFLRDRSQEHTVPKSNLLLGDSSEERARVL